MSIKRYMIVWNGEWDAETLSEAFPEANEHEVVLYTDHATEVSALREEHAKLKYAHGLEVAEVSHLRAQLEAKDEAAEAQIRYANEQMVEARAQLEAAKAETDYATRKLTAEEKLTKALRQAQLTAQPEGVRDTAMRLEGARIVLKDCGWSNTGYASIILEEIAALSTTPGASENLLRERGSRKCAVCGADWQHHVYQQTKEDYPHEFEQALATPAPATVCVCGHAKADHAEKHGWECSEECACLKYTPAPACKNPECRDGRITRMTGNPWVGVTTPCPDCNAVEGEKP